MTVCLVLLACFAALFGGYAALHGVNLRKNRAVETEGLLYDQCAAPCSRLRYGFFPASYNGCGVAATYNAALLLGAPVPPAEIIREFEWHGALLCGLFGTLPHAPRRFLRRRGFHVAKTRRRREFDRLARKAPVSILWYTHRRGAHFIALRWDGAQFWGYNVWRGGKAPVGLGASLAAFLQKRRSAFSLLLNIQPPEGDAL